jgi:shikimate kinase
MNIFLIGLPGSGKTTIGKTLAKNLNLQLIDTDDEICKSEKTSVEEIFINKGENYFREIEKKILLNVIQNKNHIISTGGGTPCFFDNMKVINEAGISIFLNVAPEIIFKRLKEQKTESRPLMKGKSDQELLNFLQTKYEERLPYYKQSMLEFSGGNITAEEIEGELKRRELI